MPNDSGSREHSEEQRAKNTDPQSELANNVIEGILAPVSAAAYSGSLLGDPRLDGRGNQPVKIAVMRQMQSTYGNRAVQRLLKNTPVQRDTPDNAVQPDLSIEQKMNAALQNSALGQEALAIKSKYSITLQWVNTGAAGYEENGNKCFINRNLDPVEAASYFTHEMHHAEEYKSGKSPDALQYKDDQEDAYVTKMVKEEIDGTMLQFEAMLQMGTAGKLSSTTAELLPQYKRVRQNAVDNHLKSNPTDQKGAEEAGKKSCKQLVNWWITSSTGEYDRSKSKGVNSKTMPKISPSSLDTYENYYVRLFRKSRSQQGTPTSTGQ